jgi:L-alanine-DL-glutamate epimerase-like enolase superfamily enzyme
VREAVGPDYVLMYDPWGTYMSLEEAIKVGRELEKDDYYWFEHPMPEYRVESYVRLCRELTIPVLSPEIAAGGVFTRAEWILRGAGDMSRIDVNRGGVTGARKTAIVAEAFGVRCEMHMAGFGNLQVCGATSEDTSEYYEKGLLAPGVDYDAPHPYLGSNCDVIDADGYVSLPQGPGMGYDIKWDYIDDNLVDADASLQRGWR